MHRIVSETEVEIFFQNIFELTEIRRLFNAKFVFFGFLFRLKKCEILVLKHFSVKNIKINFPRFFSPFFC